MSRKAKRSISMCVILVLITALALVYFLRPDDDEVADITPVIPGIRVIDLQERDVASVTFLSDTQNYAMVPYINEWNLVSWQWEPDKTFIIQDFLARDVVRLAWQLTAESIAHEDSEGLDLSAFELSPAQLTMQVAYIDGTSKNIYIGSQTADMRHHFVMISGDPAIYLMANHLAVRPMAGIESVIDRNLQPFTIEAERILIAQRDMPVIELSMGEVTGVIDGLGGMVPVTPEGTLLRLVQPMEWAIDHTRLTINVLEPLEAFRLDEIVSLMPTDLAPYGLDNPSLIFTYQDPDGETNLLFGDTFIEEVNGREITFIYVKFQDRPHVFRAAYQPVSGLYNLNVFLFIERFIALVHIANVERISVTAIDAARNFDMVVNHGPEHSIQPTVNGQEVDDAAFRIAYRLLVGLPMEGEIEPFAPQGTPDFTITYHRTDGPDTEMRFFAHEGNVYAVSVNDEDAWFVTHARDLNVFFGQVTGMME